MKYVTHNPASHLRREVYFQCSSLTRGSRYNIRRRGPAAVHARRDQTHDGSDHEDPRHDGDDEPPSLIRATLTTTVTLLQSTGSTTAAKPAVIVFVSASVAPADPSPFLVPTSTLPAQDDGRASRSPRASTTQLPSAASTPTAWLTLAPPVSTDPVAATASPPPMFLSGGDDNPGGTTSTSSDQQATAQRTSNSGVKLGIGLGSFCKSLITHSPFRTPGWVRAPRVLP